MKPLSFALLVSFSSAFLLFGATANSSAAPTTAPAVDGLPASARLQFSEDWSSGKIDPAKWYRLRKKWGNGNQGVVPENIFIEQDEVQGAMRNVLICEAHGDEYNGPVAGFEGRKSRVGGVIVSKPFFASGRFEIIMKVGATRPHPGGPADPKRPLGCVPAIWTYSYRFVEVGKARMHDFVPTSPLYNPLMERYGNGANEYWSEIDFPELGKHGRFELGMYNTFCQTRDESKEFDITTAMDGNYHTYTTDWRTTLETLPGVTDKQMIGSEGYWWICDKAVGFDRYLGNPLKRLGKDRYALCRGERATHWIDSRKVGENTGSVPAMAAQLNLGIWLPQWAGPAPWKTARSAIASVKVWQYDDPGDVSGIITKDIPNNFR